MLQWSEVQICGVSVVTVLHHLNSSTENKNVCGIIKLIGCSLDTLLPPTLHLNLQSRVLALTEPWDSSTVRSDPLPQQLGGSDASPAPADRTLLAARAPRLRPAGGRITAFNCCMKTSCVFIPRRNSAVSDWSPQCFLWVNRWSGSLQWHTHSYVSDFASCAWKLL